MDLWVFFPRYLVPCAPFFSTFMPIPITGFNDVLFLNITLILRLKYIGMFLNSRHMRLCIIFIKTWQNESGGVKEENRVYRTYKEAIHVSAFNTVFIHLVFIEDLLPAKTQR